MPAVTAENVTLIEHAAPLVIETGQVLVCANGPVTLNPERLSAAAPVLVSTITCAALVVPTACSPKLITVADSDAEGGFSPTPLGETLGLVVVTPSEPVTVSGPALEPLKVGVKVTLYWHELPPGTPAAAQLFACEKSPVV